MPAKKREKPIERPRHQLIVKEGRSQDASKRGQLKQRVPARPLARAETDDFAVAPRESGSNRGGFETEHSDANPGGTAGEHSGQRTADDDADSER